MPKVLFVNCSCFGSTGKIVSDIADYTAEHGYESVLCAPLGDGKNSRIKYYRTSLPFEQGMYRRIKFYTGYQYGFAPFSTAKIKRIIKKEMPDIVHLHCINGDMVNIYSLLNFLKKNKMRTVVTNHAEFYYTGNCIHSYHCEKWKMGCGDCPNKQEATRARLRDVSANAWKRMQKAFDGLEAVMVSVSPFVLNRAASSPITGHLPQKSILNGINTDIFSRRNASNLRERHHIAEDTKILLHVTANFSADEQDLKGGRFLIDLARRFDKKNLVVLVAGKTENDLDLPPNVILLGKVMDQELLARYYSLADLTVLTSRRETFGMPVAESLCCGTPVVGFEAGGPESIAIDEYCRFVKHADVDALEDAVSSFLNASFNPADIEREAHRKYDAKVMATQYMEIYNELIGS